MRPVSKKGTDRIFLYDNVHRERDPAGDLTSQCLGLMLSSLFVRADEVIEWGARLSNIPIYVALLPGALTSAGIGPWRLALGAPPRGITLSNAAGMKATHGRVHSSDP